MILYLGEGFRLGFTDFKAVLDYQIATGPHRNSKSAMAETQNGVSGFAEQNGERETLRRDSPNG
jgi:hypothetical protein